MVRAKCLVAACVVAVGTAACDEYVEIGRAAGLEGVRPDNPGNVEAGDASSLDVSPDASPADGSPTILWSSSNEKGDLSDWTVDGPVVGGAFAHLADLAVSQDRAHSGAYSIRIGLDASDNQDHGAGVYHRMETSPAYYGAWFFIPAAHTPKTWWTVFYFFYEKDPGNWASRQGLWDVNLNKTTLYFYDEHTMHFVDATPQKPFAIGTWVHVEAYAGFDSVRGGQVKVWLDGDLILDVSNLAEPPSPNLYWGMGSETDGITPPQTTLYMDDATISTARVGP